MTQSLSPRHLYPRKAVAFVAAAEVFSPVPLNPLRINGLADVARTGARLMQADSAAFGN